MTDSILVEQLVASVIEHSTEQVKAFFASRKERKELTDLILHYQMRAHGIQSNAELPTKMNDAHLVEELVSHCILGDIIKEEAVTVFVGKDADQHARDFVMEFFDRIYQVVTKTGTKEAPLSQPGINRILVSSEEVLSETREIKKLVTEGLSSRSRQDPVEEDKEFLMFARRCLTRPAFEVDIRYESSMDDFEKALVDTQIALNTGILRDREGNILDRYQGSKYMYNKKWQAQFDKVYLLLCQMIRESKACRSMGLYEIMTMGSGVIEGFNYSPIKSRNEMVNKKISYFNTERREMIHIFSELLVEAGLTPMEFKSLKIGLRP